ncbi:hypothetical protein AcW1_003767 [Taiwanofungus camphoratus]|nr:hypothetical protein AcW1_003767 [Antrodia cinnamomea]
MHCLVSVLTPSSPHYLIMKVNQDSEIHIVGAGCFGLSTAYHLLKRGFSKVTVLDESDTLPAPHAASSDLNKIVRSSYSDIFYARLAREAIEAWKDEKEWGDVYHESGVFVFLSSGGSGMDQAYANDMNLGARVKLVETPEELRAVWPSGVQTGFPTHSSGYLNLDGGWVDASKSIRTLMSKVTSMGGRILSGKRVTSLVQTDDQTTAVRCADGTVYTTDVVVLSVGAWTASAFPDLSLGRMCLANGQSNAMIQLSPEEAQLYHDCPVYMDLIGGVCIFPPNHENIVKCVIQTAGYTSVLESPVSDEPVSTPTFVSSKHGSRIPKKMVVALREGLSKVYPDLARKPFCGTRLCWYTDSPDDDWVIGFHPSHPRVMIATSGSGHAYKFLPVIGRLVADAIEGILEPALVSKFAVDRPYVERRASRPGLTPRELDHNDLCNPDDLLPS